MTLDALPGGRSVGSIRIERLTAPCTPPLDVAIAPAFLPTYPIAADGSFTAEFGNSNVSGCFAGGRVTYLRFEARLDCSLPEKFEIELGFGGAGVPLRSNLSFEVLGTIEGDAAGEYVVHGTFDSAGRASGTLTLHHTSFDDQEGRTYTCKDMWLSWQAARPK